MSPIVTDLVNLERESAALESRLAAAGYKVPPAMEAKGASMIAQLHAAELRRDFLKSSVAQLEGQRAERVNQELAALHAQAAVIAAKHQQPTNPQPAPPPTPDELTSAEISGLTWTERCQVAGSFLSPAEARAAIASRAKPAGNSTARNWTAESEAALRKLAEEC